MARKASRVKTGPSNLMGKTTRGIAPTAKRKAPRSPKARRVLRGT